MIQVHRPCAWWRDMVTLPELAALLEKRFEIDRTPRALGKALAELGVKPSDVWRDQKSGQGRVGYYDPIVCWAVLVATRSVVPRKVLGDRFRQCLQRGSEAVWHDFAGSPDSAPGPIRNEWKWRCQSTAVHLFISDPRHGLSPLEVVELRHVQLHRHTLDSSACLGNTLTIYMEELSALLAVRTHDEARRLTSTEAAFEREERVLASLESYGVLRASDRRLGRAPCAASR